MYTDPKITYRRKVVNFELDDAAFKSLMEERQEISCVDEKKTKYYPLYRDYPNGSKQYYERLNKEENLKLFAEKEEEEEEELPEIIGFFESMKQVKKDCTKELKSMFKGLFVKNPYF